MMAKIEWYQEILEQEPGSRVFFPLARLLVAAGRQEEAAQTLRKGLERHPDFLEARLELISLLHESASAEDCAREVDKIVKLFRACPAFWEAWAEAEQGGDLALAIDFIAQSARFPDLTLRHVFERGLAVGMQHKTPVRSGPSVSQPGEQTLPPPAGIRGDFVPEVMQSAGWQGASPSRAAKAKFGEAVSTAGQRGDFSLQAFEKKPDSKLENEAEDADELVTLRTRSMADVLAEQGDLAGALEIYQDLEAAAPTPEEAALLRERVMALAARVSEQPENAPLTSQDAENASTDDVAVPASSPKMLTLLETLADRLEARARA